MNVSKWSRENEPKPPHRFKAGEYVRLTVVTDVLQQTKDCDGSPLYTLRLDGYGWSDESLEPATEDELDAEDEPKWGELRALLAQAREWLDSGGRTGNRLGYEAFRKRLGEALERLVGR